MGKLTTNFGSYLLYGMVIYALYLFFRDVFKSSAAVASSGAGSRGGASAAAPKAPEPTPEPTPTQEPSLGGMIPGLTM